MRLKLLILIITLAATFACQSEVFTLWPYKGSGKTQNVISLPGMQEGTLHQEKINFNGLDLTLEISKTTEKWPDLIKFCQSKFDKNEVSLMKDAIRCAYKLPNGNIERILFAYAGDDKSITVFRITAPAKLPKAVWPNILPPLPAGSTPVSVMKFAKDNSIYGTFTGAKETIAEEHLRSYNASLTASGWKAMSGEAFPGGGGSGEIYMSKQKKQILLINFDSKGRGFFYLRKSNHAF